jgi:hypothetical protein
MITPVPSVNADAGSATSGATTRLTPRRLAEMSVEALRYGRDIGSPWEHEFDGATLGRL